MGVNRKHSYEIYIQHYLLMATFNQSLITTYVKELHLYLYNLRKFPFFLRYKFNLGKHIQN